MELNWEIIEKAFVETYSRRFNKDPESKAVKMMTSRFRKRVFPQFKTCREFISCNQTDLVKKTRLLGKETETIIGLLREKFCDILRKEKEQQEKDDRFSVYKSKCDLEVKTIKEDCEKKIKEMRDSMKVDAEFLCLFATGIEAATRLKGKKVEINLIDLENFRKAVSIKG